MFGEQGKLLREIDGSVIERNIFYSPNGAAVFYTFLRGRNSWPHRRSNTICITARRGGDLNAQVPPDTPGARRLATDVYADPMFVELKPGDFRLKPDSPALKMGIKQIDLKGVGLTKAFPKWLLV